MTGDERQPLRVLHLTEGARFAGIEAHLANLIPAQLARGDAAHLATFELGPLSEQMRLVGVEPHLVERAWKYDRRAVSRVCELMNAFSIDVLHTHGYLADIVGAKAVHRRRKMISATDGDEDEIYGDEVFVHPGCRDPISQGHRTIHVTTIHGLPEPFSGVAGWKMRANLWLDGRALRRADAVVAVTPNVKSYWTARGVPAENITVLPSAVAPIDRYEDVGRIVREELRAVRDELVIGFVGRLEPVKRAHLLANVAVDLVTRGVSFVIAVCGDGPERGRLVSAIEAKNVADRFRLLGHRTDVERLVQGMDVLAIISEHEGVPISLLEAMSAGVAPVAFRVGGLAEAIVDSENGFFAPDGDVAAMSTIIGELAADHARLDAISQAAQRTVRERFAPARLADDLDHVYRR